MTGDSRLASMLLDLLALGHGHEAIGADLETATG